MGFYPCHDCHAYEVNLDILNGTGPSIEAEYFICEIDAFVC